MALVKNTSGSFVKPSLLTLEDTYSFFAFKITVTDLQHGLLRVRELQADEVEDFGSMGIGEILDKLAELHLAVRLPCHIYHVDDFVTT